MRVLHHVFVVGFATVPVSAWSSAPIVHGVPAEPGNTASPGWDRAAMFGQDQQPDTLDLLLARIRDLESALGESEARVARLADSLAELRGRTEHDRAERNLERFFPFSGG
ncbi:MAG: hypothetical protein OXK74_10545 [Gemmatimonadota bacterium]|nr:hypothetical protein [Gemmatimonadota bacterium]